jgi:hypothetical protein
MQGTIKNPCPSKAVDLVFRESWCHVQVWITLMENGKLRCDTIIVLEDFVLQNEWHFRIS